MSNTGSFLNTAFAIFALTVGSVSMALADECGNLKVAGYTATRSIGPLRLTVVSNGRYEREARNDKQFIIRDWRKNVESIVDLTRGTVATRSMRPQGARGQPNAYVNRTAAGGGKVKIEMGMVGDDGKKRPVGSTICRPDGIFASRSLLVLDPKSPRMMTITQSNIRTGRVPDSAFQIPGGLKRVR